MRDELTEARRRQAAGEFLTQRQQNLLSTRGGNEAFRQETEDEDTLELMMDRIGLTKVLELLERICYNKASHLAEAWQDRPAAREWERAGALVSRAHSGKALPT